MGWSRPLRHELLPVAVVHRGDAPTPKIIRHGLDCLVESEHGHYMYDDDEDIDEGARTGDTDVTATYKVAVPTVAIYIVCAT